MSFEVDADRAAAIFHGGDIAEKANTQRRLQERRSRDLCESLGLLSPNGRELTEVTQEKTEGGRERAIRKLVAGRQRRRREAQVSSAEDCFAAIGVTAFG